jgi:hypothetical protein
MIPPFGDDGLLPEGVHPGNEVDVTFRFGSSTPGRRRLALRLRRWIDLCRAVQARRLLVDGSFVTKKADPGDIDAVVMLPLDFDARLKDGEEAAIELDTMIRTRRPEELFADGDDETWDEWVAFFARVRGTIGKRKGLVEVQL